MGSQWEWAPGFLGVLWSFRSRRTAMMVIGGGYSAVTGLVGAVFAAVTTAPAAIVVPSFAVMGLTAGLIGVFVARSRWPEGEVLTLAQRMTILQAIGEGTDVGVDGLAAATAHQARLLRESVERTFSSRAITVLAAVIFAALGVIHVVSGSMALGAMWLGIVAVQVLGFRRAGQMLPIRRTNAWNAEWYATQRLARPR